MSPSKPHLEEIRLALSQVGGYILAGESGTPDPEMPDYLTTCAALNFLAISMACIVSYRLDCLVDPDNPNLVHEREADVVERPVEEARIALARAERAKKEWWDNYRAAGDSTPTAARQ